MADGRLGKCKECNKRDVRENYALRRVQYQEYERKRNATKPRQEQLALALARARTRRPDKARAWAAVSRAVLSGKLVREPCRVCGETKVQAHHEDYSKPLDVMWFCFVHHRMHHGQHPRGSF